DRLPTVTFDLKLEAELTTTSSRRLAPEAGKKRSALPRDK
ncbi:4824_t:CDS:2, partial [Paraglomus occultum]